jgi:hypothetical protein
MKIWRTQDRRRQVSNSGLHSQEAEESFTGVYPESDVYNLPLPNYFLMIYFSSVNIYENSITGSIRLQRYMQMHLKFLSPVSQQ